MGEIITNDNIDEFLTSYIDGQINDQDTYNQVKTLIERNELIYRKFRSEMLTRNLIRDRLAPVELPAASLSRMQNTIDSIILSVSSQYSTNNIFSGGFIEYLRRLISAPFNIGRAAVPRYALAVVMIFILIAAGLLMKQGSTELNPFIATGSEKSVMVQAMKNFKNVLTGDIKPEMKSSDVNQVKSFVKNKAFDAYVPSISEYELVGAICNDYNGQKLVHLVYSSGKEIIYIYETQVNSIHCKELELPEQVHSEIQREKYYMCDHVDFDECTMIVWYNGNVLCASVSTMPKQKMYASFTSFR